MFENMTEEYLLEEALSKVSDKLDKREGAVIYDTLAPFCCELARMYADLELVLMQLFPQTAARKYLLLIAEQRGFRPKEATALEIAAYIDADVPEGARFNMQEYNYYAAEALGENMYRLVCETKGSKPNSASGTLTPINYIAGLSVCRAEEILSPGTDEEDTEDFRKRFLESLADPPAFCGNVSDYRAKVKAMEGVGMAKVFAADDWNGAGTVGIYITGENGGAVSGNFAARIEDELDPDPKGSGTGIAPIGHIVSVRPAEVTAADVAIALSIEDGASEAVIKARAATAVQDHFAKRNQKWETQNVSVYASGIIAELADLDGVRDITSVLIDGQPNKICAENCVIAVNSVEVSING